MHLSILKKQLSAALKTQDHPHLLLATDDDDVSKWYFLISGLPQPFGGGEYIMQIFAKEGYPVQPPEVHFQTPNGVFMMNTDICTSIGKYHKDAVSRDGASGWRPAMGIMGFAQEMLNGLLNHAEMHGIGIQVEPERNIMAKARASRAVNSTHPMSDIFEMLIISGPDDKEPYKTLRKARGL